MPFVVQKCLGLSEKLYKYGSSRDVEVIASWPNHMCQLVNNCINVKSILLQHIDGGLASHVPPSLLEWGCARMQVQDAMARITLDVIMATGFDLPSNAVDLDQPCPLLQDMHFLMAETFR